MPDINLKTLTLDNDLPKDGVLFGADSQGATDPSVYSTQTVATRLLGSTSLTGDTLMVASAPVLDLAQTWSNGAVTFTGIKYNTTNTNSAAASLLMDLQIDTVSKFHITKNGSAHGTLIGSGTATFGISAATGIGFYSSNRVSVLADGQIAMLFGSNQNIVANGRSLAFESAASGAGDTFITRKNTRIIQLGAADAATALAQTLTVQSVVGGTTGNVVGQNFTINGSQGVGSGVGGSIIFQVAPAGTLDATTQNGLLAALTINSTGKATFVPTVNSTSSFEITNLAGQVMASADSTNRRFNMGGGVFSVSGATGGSTIYNTGFLGWTNSGSADGTADLFLRRKGTANLQLGGFEAASPVAQTLSVQSVVAGTSNTAGAAFTITGSQNTGSGLAGNLIVSTGFSNTVGTATVTITIATPGVITWTAHGLVTGSPVVFTTTGALPTGINAGTTYFAITSSTLGVNTFQIATTAALAEAGTAVATSGTQSGVQTATTSATVQSPLMTTATFGPSGLTGSQIMPVLELDQTWNTSGNATGIKLSVTNTASGASSLLMDLQVGTVSQFKFGKDGTITVPNLGGVTGTGNLSFRASGGSSIQLFGVDTSNSMFAFQMSGSSVFSARSTAQIGFSSGADANGGNDTILTRKGIANLQLGAADAASPVAQKLSVQSVVATTSGNIAGQNFTINGSQGVGSGAGGSIIFQVAPAGTLGDTTQNTLLAALTINADNASFGSRYSVFAGRASATSFMTLSGTNKVTALDTTNGYCVATGYGYTFTGSGDATTSIDLRLVRDDPNILAQRNGVNAQAFRVYKTYTDGSNYERGVFDWTTTANTLTIGTQKLGSGTARPLELQTDGTAVLTLATDGSVTQSGTYFKLNNRGGSCQVWIGSESTVSAFIGTITSTPLALRANNTAWLTISTTGLLQLQGATSSFPALKRSTTSLQARLADDSAFTNIQGKLTTDNAYAAGGVLAATGSITIYDSTGTAYRVPCLV
jgi:hypothetical protein